MERRAALIAGGWPPAMGAAAIAAPEVICHKGGLSENLGEATLTGHITVVFVRAELEKRAQLEEVKGSWQGRFGQGARASLLDR